MTISRYELKNEISASNELENIVMWSSTVTRHKSSSHSDFKMLIFFKFQPCFKADVFYWWSLGEILHSPTILKGNGDVSGWWSSLLPWKRLPHSELLLPWRDCLFVCLPQSGHDSPPTCSSKRFLSWRMLGRNNSWWFVGREVLHSLRDHPNIKWFIVMYASKVTLLTPWWL